MTRHEQPAARVLIVDVDPSALRTHSLALRAEGHLVQEAQDGAAAKEVLERGAIDVLVCDVILPGGGCFELLEQVRALDPFLPVVVLTSVPTRDTPVRAVELGAFCYLEMPVGQTLLVEAVQHAWEYRRGVAQRMAPEAKREETGPSDEALGARVDAALETLFLAWQPIVTVRERTAFGYEAFLRSGDTSLPTALGLLEAAERLGRLGRAARAARGLIAAEGRNAPTGLIFANTSPLELAGEDFEAEFSALAGLECHVVLELKDRWLDQVPELASRLVRLRALGLRIAVDDFGTGRSGLAGLAALKPDFAKVDTALIRGLSADPGKATLLRTVLGLCHDLAILPIAKGVETMAERDALLEAGCDLQQGNLFASPQRGFPTPVFER